MNGQPYGSGGDLPEAKALKRRWNPVWLVPIVAAVVAGYLVYQRAREYGATVTIVFREVSGIRPDQTLVRYRGVEVGQVSEVRLGEQASDAIVEVRLRREAEFLAREGALFWVVRPEFAVGGISGLGSLLSGPYIEARAGGGSEVRRFVGLESSPELLDPQGLEVVLLARQGGGMGAGLPIYYRGYEVGAVRESKLRRDGRAVEIHCVIQRRYAPLVRAESRFWNVSGLDLRVGLFRGAEFNVESLKSLMLGGIAFATPERVTAGPLPAGTVFELHESAEDKWLEWSPAFELESPGYEKNTEQVSSGR